MNFRDSINRSFRDSYGWDKLSSYFVILAILLSVVSRWFALLGMVLVIWAVWRSLSKNKYKRYQEEAAFEYFLSNVNCRIKGISGKFSEKLHYKVFTCPNCSQKLRVPRHKGKITITCKKCFTEFKAKS